jgi:hypothetical protein
MCGSRRSKVFIDRTQLKWPIHAHAVDVRLFTAVAKTKFALCASGKTMARAEHDAGQVRGGPNSILSLTTASMNFTQYGASDMRFTKNVRPALPHER